ncbi:MAG: long-chain fatty acid--CoA ligase [Candidatus Helarchaeota archaeon]|nr:long-chain fatty acid--CoA ligase [Candidatus Helarchaeota archaeon]
MAEEKIYGYYKKWPDYIPKTITIPEIPLDQLLRDSAKKYPDNDITEYFGFKITYKEMDTVADRITTYLQNKGMKKGDVVALYLTNVPPLIAAYYGIIRAGCVATLISPLFGPLEVKYQLKDSGAKILIIWEGFSQIFSNVASELPNLQVIWCSLAPWLGASILSKEGLVESEGNQIYLENLIKNIQEKPIKVPIASKDDMAVLQYTGGTTGLPKGAILTHYNIIANCYQCAAVFPHPEYGKEVILGALPFYHIYAQTVVMNFGILIGAMIPLVSNPRNVDELISVIETSKVTIFPGVAALYNLINNTPEIEKRNLKSIKYCLSGAGPLPGEIQKKFEDLTGAKLVEGYGLTEASPVTHANPLLRGRKNGTIGLPVPNTRMKIVSLEDPTKIMRVNEIGELCVKGPQVMKGYHNRPEETKKTIIDDWLLTGDIAMVDEDGYTKIVDRKKDLVKYKGHSVYPTEIENLLFENPAILDCAVIGVPDAEAGETIKAFVVLKPEYIGKVTPADIIEWAKQNMAKYKYPRFVEFMSEIPKGAAGKTLRRELRESKQ